MVGDGGREVRVEIVSWLGMKLVKMEVEVVEGVVNVVMCCCLMIVFGNFNF